MIRPREQLSRTPRTLPTLRLNPEVRGIFDFSFDDIAIGGYEPLPTIKAPVAVQHAPMRITLIAALDRNFAIGKGGALPWHLPDDLKRFKALTLDKPSLMGRQTAESLGRALPKRCNLVLPRTGCVPFEGMQAVASVNHAIGIAAVDGDELCVIGGARCMCWHCRWRRGCTGPLCIPWSSAPMRFSRGSTQQTGASPRARRIWPMRGTPSGLSSWITRG